MKKGLLKIGFIGVLFLSFQFLAISQDYNEGYPSITNISTTSVTAEVNATVGGVESGWGGPQPTHYTLYRVEEHPGTSPKTEDIKDDNDGSIGLEEADSTFSADLEELISETDYIIHFVTIDNDGNVVIETSGTPTSVPFTTAAPLTIDTYSPEDDATGVAIDQDLVLTFSENIERGSGLLTIYKDETDEDFQEISAESSKLSISGNQLTISHTDFELSTAYYIEIEQGYVSAADSEATFEGITDNTTWNFTTETPISYTSLFPPDDATDAFQDKELIITFPENIERGTGTLTIYDDTNTDFQSIIATSSKLTISGNKLRVSHDEFNLPASYYVKVPMGFVKSASSGKDFEGISDPTSWNFSTDNLNVWSGGSDTNWNDNGNWDTGSFGAGYNVVLPEGLSNYPEITSSDDISVNSLYIESNAWLTHTGGDLTVDGDFILESSPVDGEQNAAYLPHGGNLTVNGNVQIQQVISDPEGNYYVSPPTDGATMESIGVTDAMVKWNNSTGNYDYLTPSDPLVPGTGYVTRNPDRVVFNGTINTGDVTANVSRSSDGLGWNLIGNPYTASISFEEIDLAGVDSSFWVYRQDLGIYGTYNMGSGDLPPVYTNMPDDNPDLIPSNQSFWIRVNEEETGGSVGFTPDKTFTNAHAYMKSSSQNDSVVKLATNFKGNRDETAVRLTHLAKEEKDRYDSPKKKSANKNYCHIYSHSDHRELAINSMPLKTDTTSINLGIEHNGDPSENCDISLVQNTLPDGYMVLLEDKENGVLVELSDDSPYTYKSDQKGTINDRFVLHLTDVATHANEEISVNQNDNKEKIRIFTNNSQIIAYIDQLNNPAFKLLDVNGRLLKSGQLNANSKNYIPVEHKGVVLFVIESDERTKTFKTVF